MPAWADGARENFVTRLLDDAAPGYPCHFGVRAQQQGRNAFAAFDRGDSSSAGIERLAQVLLRFYERTRSGPRRTSLVVFVGPPEPQPSLERDRGEFWRILGALREHDPRPWPADQPADAADRRWQWCFNGEPWFVIACSPAYRARRSRNLGPCLTIVFQTLRVFEGLSGSTTPGKLAKQRIRAQLERYDLVGPHPHLGDSQQSSFFKWRQYSLPDDQATLPPEACPFTSG